ncbi:hypothetical protein ANN_04757 [Periplaneta americana]|uniref:Uncharacterized protein n=1 Tax=Periplaneta americana TaxID=6978 RepID=A0ABQ8TB47_PERAM|nr:hypothetical protein ANN_04757 [Periplaneta americana]
MHQNGRDDQPQLDRAEQQVTKRHNKASSSRFSPQTVQKIRVRVQTVCKLCYEVCPKYYFSKCVNRTKSLIEYSKGKGYRRSSCGRTFASVRILIRSCARTWVRFPFELGFSEVFPNCKTNVRYFILVDYLTMLHQLMCSFGVDGIGDSEQVLTVVYCEYLSVIMTAGPSGVSQIMTRMDMFEFLFNGSILSRANTIDVKKQMVDFITSTVPQIKEEEIGSKISLFSNKLLRPQWSRIHI